MRETPVVSVLMNCFNGEKYLEYAIESVLNQTFDDWELLFWDNCSIDNSATIIRNYSDSRIRYFRADRHTSLGEARELARRHAEGQWITVLDVDDYWLKNNLEVKLQNDIRGDVGIIYSRYIVDRSLAQQSSFVMPKRKSLEQGYVYQNLAEKNFLPLINLLYRKTACDDVGGFGQLPFSADYDLNLKIAEKWQVLAVDEVTAVYRLHGRNHSIKHWRDMINEREDLIERLPRSLQKRAKSCFLSDQLLGPYLDKKAVFGYLNNVSLKLVFRNLLQRILRRITYRVSAVRITHIQLVKSVISH